MTGTANVTVEQCFAVTGGRTVSQLGSIGGIQLIAVAAADSPDDCSLGSASEVAEVISGQIFIVDAPALPTSRTDCKNGGWAQFGLKRQGQCIRSIRLIPAPGPYPSSRAACQHGDWAQYGVKSKRRCLRFVRLRRARSPGSSAGRSRVASATTRDGVRQRCPPPPTRS